MNQRHSHRDDLTGEHKLGDMGQVVFAALFFIIWIGDTFFFRFSTFPNDYVPVYIRGTVGILLLIISAYLMKSGLQIVFGDVRENPGVIRKGVFGVVRHPVYLSEILLYSGFLVLHISLAASAVWIAAIIFLNKISKYEENLLLERFGEDYRKYMEEVPMWLPRIKKKLRHNDSNT